jgi:hypothetical protein
VIVSVADTIVRSQKATGGILNCAFLRMGLLVGDLKRTGDLKPVRL